MPEELLNEPFVPLMPRGWHFNSGLCVARSTDTLVERVTNAADDIDHVQDYLFAANGDKD